MSAHTDFFCKRCRADDAKRCRCPLPILRAVHDWDADAAYNLWPDAPNAPSASTMAFDGQADAAHELSARHGA